MLLGPLSAVTRAYESCSCLRNLDGRGRTDAFKTGGWSTTEKRFEDVGSYKTRSYRPERMGCYDKYITGRM